MGDTISSFFDSPSFTTLLLFSPSTSFSFIGDNLLIDVEDVEDGENAIPYYLVFRLQKKGICVFTERPKLGGCR